MNHLAACLTLLLFGGSAFIQLLGPLPATRAGDGRERARPGAKQKDRLTKNIKPEPGGDQNKACRSDEIGTYLLRHNIRPSSPKSQERLLSGIGEVRVIYLVP